MALKDRIKRDTADAMRAKDAVKLSALRMLSAAIQRREVDERITLDDSQVMAATEKLIKQSRESIEQYEKGARADLAAKERADIAVWQAYLPQPLTDAEIDTLIADAIAATSAASIKDMGKVMGTLKPKLQGRADMGQVGAKIKSRLGA
jgi:uncharacterized protein YqeY